MASADAAASDGRVHIHVDGACLGNPGPGGWAALLCWHGREKELVGADAQTTNNRMELTAAIEALAALKRPSQVCLTTDSTYVRDGITRWIAGWKRNGWQTADRKPVKNADLWVKLDDLAARHTVEWRWIKGHSGDSGNERVDRLARAAAQDIKTAAAHDR